MSDDLFLPGRPPQRTSIACMLQRHRWDDVQMVCGCCGISQREYAVQMRQPKWEHVPDPTVRPEHK